jgi:hypothetical protein
LQLLLEVEIVAAAAVVVVVVAAGVVVADAVVVVVAAAAAAAVYKVAAADDVASRVDWELSVFHYFPMGPGYVVHIYFVPAPEENLKREVNDQNPNDKDERL